jgi:hypothetical protein
MGRIKTEVVDGIKMEIFLDTVITAEIEVDEIKSRYDVEQMEILDNIYTFKVVSEDEICDCVWAASWPNPSPYQNLDIWDMEGDD